MSYFFPFIPKPLLFNPLKHHLGYIKKFVNDYVGDDYSKLRLELSVIGNSQMDLYTGALPTVEISRQLFILINNSLLINKSSYFKFIHELNDHYKITISDGSEWILREGLDSERYIHFHPARYSPDTIRIKANSLKSLIAARILCQKQLGLCEFNHIRSEILHLEPLQKLSSIYGVGKYLNLISS